MKIFGTKTEIGPDTVLQRKHGILHNYIDGEVVMMSPDFHQYLGLNKVASHIWELLENPRSISQLEILLMNEYNVSLEQCSIETSEFVEQLLDKQLICIIK
jgi:hypothetical protein